jgi:hypothetical protein
MRQLRHIAPSNFLAPASLPAACASTFQSERLPWRVTKLNLISVGLIPVSTPQLQITPEIVRTAADLRVLIGRLSRRLKARGVAGDLTMPEAMVLARLERGGPATPGALAKAERVQPQSMGATLAGLAERGLVSRSHDPGTGATSGSRCPTPPSAR